MLNIRYALKCIPLTVTTRDHTTTVYNPRLYLYLYVLSTVLGLKYGKSKIIDLIVYFYERNVLRTVSVKRNDIMKNMG